MGRVAFHALHIEIKVSFFWLLFLFRLFTISCPFNGFLLSGIWSRFFVGKLVF